MTDFKEFLDDIARELPIIRPIKEFIHLNLLLRYQHFPFWEALWRVSDRLEAVPFPEPEFYKTKIQKGEIPLNKVMTRLEKILGSEKARENIDLILKDKVKFIHHDHRAGRLHELWNTAVGVNIMSLADGVLIKWVGMYMDQGISLWQMPDAGNKSFYHAIRDLLKSSLVKPAPFNRKTLDAYFPKTSEECLKEHLNFLCPDRSMQNEYLTESIFTLRGWAGLIYSVERNPDLIPHRRDITLVDFLAVKLILEKAWILNHRPEISAPDLKNSPELTENLILDEGIFQTMMVCQEAFEEMSYKKLFDEIKKENDKKKAPAFQAVFCMDDRECALRRHLETICPVETFGTAGHFGIECLYQHSHDAYPKKQCPAPVPAKVFIRDMAKVEKKNRNLLSSPSEKPTHNLLKDWIFSFPEAFRSTFSLSMNLFFPLAFKKENNVREVQPNSELMLLLKDGSTTNGLPNGYTHEEMANIIQGQLKVIGFVNEYAPLIFIFGHGSKSTNNPYFATYHCGACSGRPGSANARSFVKMANDPVVRKILKDKYSIVIPEKTRFMAGYHDTTRDIIEIYDSLNLTDYERQELNGFKSHLSLALRKNAAERAQAFKRVSYSIELEAHKEVLKRSYSLFETRPELGHTNVSYAIVARRELSLGKNFGRRAFLQSYDPTIDPEGNYLAQLLSAVVPVCSGISLDYYFSRVDNQRFGAGSKLPQNIVGNIGLSHGTESDLLVGLPFQMIDQHQPIRLFVLVEQVPDVALKVIQGNALVKEIITNSWVHYGCYDHSTKSFYRYKDGEMVKENL